MTSLRDFRENAMFWPTRALQGTLNLINSRSHKPTVQSVVVSLTSYPRRFKTLPLVLDSLLAQSVRPHTIFLTLCKEEVVASDTQELVETFDRPGITLNLEAGNIRSYKKIIPALEAWPDKAIVTCDDDKLYPRTWLEQLLDKARVSPNSVICHRARIMVGQSPSTWTPYQSWLPCATDVPSMAVFPIGSGGVLFPAGSLGPYMPDTRASTSELPSTDDIWLKLMAWKNGVAACQVRPRPSRFTSVPMGQAGHLSDTNLTQGGNDAAISLIAERYGFIPGAVLT